MRGVFLFCFLLLAVSGQDETFDQCSEEVCRKAIPIPKAPGKMLTDRQQDVVFEIFAKNLEMCKQECISKWKEGGREANLELISSLSKLQYEAVDSNSRRLK